MDLAPFAVVEPEGAGSPVVVEVPHAGLFVDAESAAWMTAPTRSLARDADLYVDELFADSPSQGATLIYARTSRYVVDLNRAEDDYDGAAVAGGPPCERPRGVVWRLTSDGFPVLRDRLTAAEYRRRCDTVYRPYHRALRGLLEGVVQRFGFAVLLCAHSMPTPRGAGGGYADLVPGTRGRSTAADSWIDLVERTGREHGWVVQHDTPYRGGYTTSHYGRPASGVHAVQIEIARRLYMDEHLLGRSESGFPEVRRFARTLVANLVRDALDRPRPHTEPRDSQQNHAG
jgi:N-formylglutamate amidohydrolase